MIGPLAELKEPVISVNLPNHGSIYICLSDARRLAELLPKLITKAEEGFRVDK